MLTRKTNNFQQIIDKATSQIEALDKQRAEVEARSRALEAERESIESRRVARENEMSMMQETLREVTQHHEMLEAQSVLAEGTQAYRNVDADLKAALAEKRKQEQSEQKMRSRHVGVEQKDTARLAQIQSEQVQQTERLTLIATQRSALEMAQEQARKDEADHTYTEVASGLFRLLKLSEQARNEADQAEQLVQQALEAGLERLSEWPEHRQKLQALAPYNDDTTRCIESGIAHLETLIAHIGGAVPYIDGRLDGLGIPTVVGRHYKQFLAVNERDLDAGKQSLLRAQQARLKLLLEAYRQQAK